VFSLEGKTVVVTGASSGIGKSIAILCSKVGAKVIITARREERLKETISEMQGENEYIVADLTRQEGIEELVSKLPKLDGIVHCAGVGSTLFCKNISEKDIDAVMRPNFVAPVLLQSSLLANKKISKAASVVIIASLASQSPAIGNALYSASKGALVSYAKCMALELAPRKIRVNCISPAMVRTDFLTNINVDENALQEDEMRYPLGRYGKPEDVAGLTVYLLSDESEWMTGNNIEITGGVKCL
jgi:NAD(P)-dependent dehydrogenase (short-subunit alcohol dehydrogenase family)